MFSPHHRRGGLSSAAVGLLLCGVLVACSDPDDEQATTPATTNPAPTTPITPIPPDVQEVPEQHKIVVSATGGSQGVPDTVTLSLGVEVQAPSTTELTKKLAETSDRLVGFLRAQGIAEADLQTTNLYVNPQYDYSGGSPFPPLVGYIGTVSVQVRVDDLELAGTIVDGAAETVGDALRVQGLTWTIKEADAVRAAARADAVVHAREQARQYADAAGWDLGEIVSISETPGYATPYGRFAGEGDSAGMPIPFEPGSELLQVNITVEFTATDPD